MARSPRLTIIADSGAIVALLDQDDAWHERVITWWRSERRDILLPVTVLPEVCYLVQRRLGVQAELRFVRSVADGEFTVEALETADVERAAELLETYRDLAIGFVDATVVAFAERLDAPTVLTTDRRHFSVVRPRHAERFTLVP